MAEAFDLIVIGAGSGGLTAAEFAARLGIKVALIEKDRIGGDCTWTGCIPSKALLKVAKMAHHTRTAGQYGIETPAPVTNMAKVRDYIHQTIADIYQHETPRALAAKNVEVVFGAAQFVDPHTIRTGDRTLIGGKFIICTGAHPFIPPFPGLQDVPFVTYEQIFENTQLPQRFLVIGAGPVGAEIAQAYQRLGSQVTLIDGGFLPKEEPEVANVMGQVFAREGIRFVEGMVTAARQDQDETVISVGKQEFRGDMLLVAVGRAPNVDGLQLERAGIKYSAKGIEVDANLRTNAKHIFAVGDCVAGNHQFTHVAGWQAVQVVRNAFLPGNSSGFSEIVPFVTFTDPEVARVGLTVAEAWDKFGNGIQVTVKEMGVVDRAVVENDTDGFIKVIHKKNGKLLGATVVAERAGDMITEFSLALHQGLKLADLVNVIHAYPTYSIGTMQLAGDVTVENLLHGFFGKVLRRLAGGTM
jgi:pyruvate/2-oxoglutarate dehydrogenase complex dihydrolipoamide dehydrogenase (E3) component